MTDSEEETVDRQAITFFVRFTPTFHQIYTFHSIITIQTDSVVFEKNFNLLMLHHTLLHNLRCTQVRFANHQIYFGCQTSQIDRFLTGGISTAHHCNDFLPVEETVTSSTSANSHSGVFLFVFQSQVFGRSTGRCFRFNHLITVNRYFIRSFAQICRCSNTETDVCSETAGLRTQIFHQLRTTDSFRITGEVLHIRSSRQLTTRLQSFIKHRTKVSTSCIDRCRISGRP